jgi:hypothetical protein
VKKPRTQMFIEIKQQNNTSNVKGKDYSTLDIGTNWIAFC